MATTTVVQATPVVVEAIENITNAATSGGDVDVARFIYILTMVSGLAWLVLTAIVGPFFGDILGGHGDFGGHDIGGGDVGGHDVGGGHFDAQGDIHFSPMSPAVISAFVGSFGCGGLLGMGIFGLTSIQALPIALGTGLIIAGTIYVLIRYVYMNVQGSIEVNPTDLIGATAEVITSIPKNGVGAIAYATGAGRQTSSARSEDGKPIPTNCIVEIVRLSGSVKIVRREQTAGPEAASGEAW